MPFVQNGYGGGGYVPAATVTLASNVVAGDGLFLNITVGAADTISSITDTQSNTWVLVASAIFSGARQTLLYYVQNANAGATTVTVTFGAYPDSSLILVEWSGLVTSSMLDKYATAYDSGYVQNHSAGPTATTTQASELVIIAGGADASAPTWGAGSGFSGLLSNPGGASPSYTSGAMAFETVSSTGAYSGTLTTSSYQQGQAVIATFKLAGGAIVPFDSLLLAGD
jgi:hypothetical protein